MTGTGNSRHRGPDDPDTADLLVSGEVWYWRGPSPYYFVLVPPAESETLHDASARVTYGWGMIPVRARIGDTEWQTSLFPKDGIYLVPLKDAVRRAEGLDEGAPVEVRLVVPSRRSP